MNIIVACAVLNNIAILNRFPVGDEVEEVIEPPVVPQDVREDKNHRGHARRAGIVGNIF